MPIAKEDILAELRDVLREVDEVSKDGGSGTQSEAIALCRSAVERYTPPEGPYRRQLAEIPKSKQSLIGHARQFRGALAALIRDVEKDRLRSFEELLHANEVGDFLDQADELHKKGYKDAAAVIAGCVLEQHLRRLAARNGVGTYSGGRPKKADQLNPELAAKGVYSKTEQKLVLGLLGRRNEAAHGDTTAFDHRQAREMIDAVQAFVVRYPA